jgi:hypothetical protein
MRTNLKRALGIGVALCLGLTSACIRVNVTITSTSAHTLPADRHWISIPDLKELHKERLGVKKCPASRYPIIAPEEQLTEAWCWAASTRMVMEYQNKQQTKGPETDIQCNIITKTIGNSQGGLNCCDYNVPSPCIQGGWPHWVFNSYQFDYKVVPGALDDWDAVTGEICSTGPFILVIDWREGGSHTLVITGYSNEDKDTERVVTTYDPFTNDFEDLSFEEFVGGSLNGPNGIHRFSHDRTYVQIKSKAEDRP